MASASVLVAQEEAAGPSATYSYCSRPRAVQAQRRQRYRTSLEPNELEEEPIRYANLMYERRVVRGNTYALHVLPWSSEPDPLELQRQREAQRKALARKRAKEQLRTRTPEPLEGRRHVDVQTELYLEEIADRIVEVDMECQTDAFLDRPSTPLFIPAKSGRDVATQIWEGELFDFDIEVRPMLEVLVGKTIEQALLEVMEEEELADLRAHQYAYHELRLAELAEVQRLEEQERRHREEKERRKKQQLQALQKEKETSEKIAARAFAQRYLSDLLPSVFGSLRDSGYFYDPVERDIETGFVTWMMDQVEETMEKRVLGRTLADSLIRQVTEMRLESFQQGALLYPYNVEVVQPPEEEKEMEEEEEEEEKEKEEKEKEEEEAGQEPAAEEVMPVPSGETEASDQLDAPLQPGPLDLPEVAGPVEVPAEPEPSAPPPPDGLDEPLNAVQPDLSDQPEAPDQGKEEGAPDTEPPEPQE